MAQIKWQSIQATKGIQYYEQDTTKRGGPRKDRYYRCHFQLAGKKHFVGLGWESDGMSLDKAIKKRALYYDNTKQGIKPRSPKEEVELAQAEEQARKEEEKKKAKLNLTFDKFWTDKYLPQAKQDKKESSWQKEVSLYDKWISPVLKDLILKDIKASDIEELKSNVTKAGKSPRTVQYVLATVRQVINHAIRHECFHDINPVKKVKMPTTDNKRARYLTPDEVDKLFKKLKKVSQQLHDMSLLSLHTGMRAGEIFNLTWDCVDFDQEMILVRDAKDAARGSKSRYVYMTKSVKAMLKGKHKNQTSGLVFPDRKGNKIEMISQAFRKAVDDLKLNKGVTDKRDRVVFHTLRHTFASWQVQQGLSLYEVQKLLGHESYTMVQRYAHLAPENHRKATALFDRDQTNPGKVLHINQ